MSRFPFKLWLYKGNSADPNFNIGFVDVFNSKEELTTAIPGIVEHLRLTLEAVANE